MSTYTKPAQAALFDANEPSEIRRTFDADFGRQHQFPGLDGEYSDEETSEAIAYLRSVR